MATYSSVMKYSYNLLCRRNIVVNSNTREAFLKAKGTVFSPFNNIHIYMNVHRKKFLHTWNHMSSSLGGLRIGLYFFLCAYLCTSKSL